MIFWRIFGFLVCLGLVSASVALMHVNHGVPILDAAYMLAVGAIAVVGMVFSALFTVELEDDE